MNWDNFGTVWKIGHIMPLCAFDQTNEEDLKLCWNWINLRPVRDSASRRRFSGIEAERIFEWRQRFFEDNPVIGELLVRARRMAEDEGRGLIDWSMFHVEC